MNANNPTSGNAPGLSKQNESSDFDDQSYRLLRAITYLDLLNESLIEPSNGEQIEPKMLDRILIMLEVAKEVIETAKGENAKLQMAFKKLRNLQ